MSSLTASGQVKGATVVGTSGVYGKIMGSNTAAVTTLTASGVIAGATGVNGTPLVLNVGRGDVTFEYNTYDRGNDDGAGITIRTSANPVLDSMFAVRSSGHASRLWVGQDFTSVGANKLCAGYSGANGGEGVLGSYNFVVNTNGDVAISSNLAVDTNTLFVDSVGNKVGIGTTIPGYKLHVDGDIYATGDVTASSDRRLKTDIKRIENALDKVCAIGGYMYMMNDKPSTGLIAQEVLEVLPEVVHGSEETSYSLAYGNVIGLLVEAIKELKEKIG